MSPFIVSDNSGGGDFTPHPIGMHQAVCIGVNDLGEEYSEMFSKAQRKLVVRWETAERMEDGRRFGISKRYTVSLNEKATLRHDLENWRGRPFTDAELEGFDLEALVGKNCTLNVIHKPKKKGGVAAVVASVNPAIKGAEVMVPEMAETPKWVMEVKAANDLATAARNAAKGGGGQATDANGSSEVPF